ncbi:porin family protein [Breoghania sp. L-A4]|nr:porin family protein [Breoghania sp. L-A4]
MAAAAGSAQAADPSYSQRATATDWSGFYLGVHAGYVDGQTDWDLGPGVPLVVEPSGFAGGALVGYNHQIDNFVFGLEADITLGDISEGPKNFGVVGVQSADVNYIATVRGRLGYAFDTWMPFVTGGAGFADLEIFDSIGGGPTRDSQLLTGFVVGAGVEADLSRLFGLQIGGGSLTGRVEYMYGQYGSELFQIGATPEGADLETNTVRAALVWRFSGLSAM